MYKTNITATDIRQSNKFCTFKETVLNLSRTRRTPVKRGLLRMYGTLKTRNAQEIPSFKIDWSVVKRAAAYRSEGKRCNLFLRKQLQIMKADTKDIKDGSPNIA